MNFNDIIHQNYEELSDMDLSICQFVIENKSSISNMSITDFARKSLSSKSSVIRFAQKLGFNGYSEMKNFIKWETSNVTPVETTATFFDQVLTDTLDTIQQIKEANWSEIYGVLNKCSRIYVICTGVTQKNQAAEIQRLFLLIGKPVQVIPGNAQSVEFRRIVEGLNEDDVLFLLSLSGENIGLEGILNILNIKKSVIISITNFKSNWLSGRSTYNLYASSSRSPLPQDWWLQTASTFFILIETFAFGFVDYQRNLQNL